jgi:hypothetical protein
VRSLAHALHVEGAACKEIFVRASDAVEAAVRACCMRCVYASCMLDAAARVLRSHAAIVPCVRLRCAYGAQSLGDRAPCIEVVAHCGPSSDADVLGQAPKSSTERSALSLAVIESCRALRLNRDGPLLCIGR